jgi:hypothetical protein
MTPFGVPSVPGSKAWIAQFAPGPPPALTSTRYAKDYKEVKRVGAMTSDLTARPQDRADVARFYAASSPSFVFNLAARQVATAEGTSLAQNARVLALLNVASNDSLVASFWTKYHYNFWRPETAIRNASTDGNDRTAPDGTFVPFIATPCFPGYPSAHATLSNAGREVMEEIYGGGQLSISLTNPAVPGVTLNYTTFTQISDDIDDARIYGGIHFRTDQDAGSVLGRKVGKYVYNHNLRSAHGDGCSNR